MRMLIVILSFVSLFSEATSVIVKPIEMPAYAEKPAPVAIGGAKTLLAIEQLQLGKVELIRLGDSKELLKTIYSNSFVRFAQMQRQIPIGILLTGGRVSLSTIANQLPDYLIAQGDRTYLATIPIIIDIDATLELKPGEGLLLSQNTGSFLHNSGSLKSDNATISGWNATNQSASKYTDDSKKFRPFIIAFGGSTTVLFETSLSSLGFDESSSYGFTVRTATQATLNQLSVADRRIVEKPPQVFIESSRFSDMYVGLYMDGVVDSHVVRSEFLDNIDTGILVSNASENILISENTVAGTRNKHGIVLSIGVANSQVLHNTVQFNARSGILLDRLVDTAVVAFNNVNDNRKDGISVYESLSPLIYGNRAFKNRNHGIRVRGSRDAKLHHNVILGNRGAAVYLHHNAHDSDESFSAEVLGGLMVENASGAIFSDGQSELTIGELKLEKNGSQNYRGDLAPLSSDIILATWKDGSAVRITEVEEP